MKSLLCWQEPVKLKPLVMSNGISRLSSRGRQAQSLICRAALTAWKVLCHKQES
ncbi:hypothetical protein Nmel_010713 [Mimus melanotis]